MSSRDYYEILGVGRSASDEETVHTANLIKYHPDKNGTIRRQKKNLRKFLLPSKL